VLSFLLCQPDARIRWLGASKEGRRLLASYLEQFRQLAGDVAAARGCRLRDVILSLHRRRRLVSLPSILRTSTADPYTLGLMVTRLKMIPLSGAT
jgi:hypothetical protein